MQPNQFIPYDVAQLINVARQRLQGMGLDPGPEEPSTLDELRRLFTLVPAWYTITIDLLGDTGAANGGSVPLRPEPFLLTRITWATNGDVPVMIGDTGILPGYSCQGRSCRVEWGDEFTKFLGDRPALVSALFGDSNGFLDIQGLALFQGKQTLNARLTRLGWPFETDPVLTTWDFTFAGFGILPKGVHQSGSAG